jgi:putative nucleotidyltransferase with HDIG domain
LTPELPAAVRDAILARGELYEVGGSVRDRFMGVDMYDRDYLATGIPMPELVELLGRFGRADWVGRSFGVVKFTYWPERDAEGVTVDIALPRTEKSTGSGHRDFEVDYDPSLPVEDDLRRRDFTVNAIAIRLRDGAISDPHGGRDDLAARLLRLIFPDAFAEDPLRMLRAIGLVARFDFKLDADLRRRLEGEIGLLREVSAERIAEELNKILLLAGAPSGGLRLMEETRMLDVLLPELRAAVGCDQPGPYHAYDVFEHTVRVVDASAKRLALRWAALLHDVEKPSTRQFQAGKVTFYNHETLGAETARRILSRLRYGNDLINHVAVLIERHLFNTDMGDKGLRRLIRAVGIERMADLLDLRRADVVGQGMGGRTDDVDEFAARITAEIEKKPPFSRSDLAVNGFDLMKEFDLAPGRRLGLVLDFLLEKVLDEPDKNDRTTLLNWAKEYLNGGATLAAACVFAAVALLGG